MFRAFLGVSQAEIDLFTAQDYIDHCVMLKHVLKIWERVSLAPYITE